MKSLSLKIVRFFDVVGALDSTQPSDLGGLIRDIRLVSNTVNDLEQALADKKKGFFEKQTALLLAEKEAARPIQEQFEKESAGLDEVAKKALTQKMQSELDAVMKKYQEENAEKIKEFKDFSEAKVTIELADDKFDKVKELFGKEFIKKKFENLQNPRLAREALLDISEALGIE